MPEQKLKRPPTPSPTMSAETTVQLVDWLDELQNMTQSMAKKMIDMRKELTQLTLIVKQLNEKVDQNEETKH